MCRSPPSSCERAGEDCVSASHGVYTTLTAVACPPRHAPDVHPVVTADESAVERFAVLQLDELREGGGARSVVGGMDQVRRRAGGLTIGLPVAVRNSESGSMASFSRAPGANSESGLK